MSSRQKARQAYGWFPSISARCLYGLLFVVTCLSCSLFPRGAFAQSNPCVLTSKVAYESPDATQAVFAAANALEQALALGTLTRRDLIEKGGSLAISPQVLDNAADKAVAAYCVAFGEFERQVGSGPPTRAQQMLRSAYARSRQVHDASLAARAAYRLALTQLGDERPTYGAGVGPGESGDGTSGVEAGCDALLTNADADSLQTFKCAAHFAEQTADYALLTTAELQIARRYVSVQDVYAMSLAKDQAGKQALEAIKHALQIGDLAKRAALLDRLIETALQAGAGTASELPAAIQDMVQADPALEAESLYLRARLAKKVEKSGDALILARQAVALESEKVKPLKLHEYLLFLSDIDPEHREADIDASYRALQAIRPLLPLTDPVTEQSVFTTSIQPVFESKVDIELARGSANSVVVAQEVVESYRVAELQNVFGAECVPIRTAIAPSDLREGEVILYPIVLKDRIDLIYAKAGQDHYSRLSEPNFTRDDVVNAVSVLRTSLAVSSKAKDWPVYSKRLYAALIKPLERNNVLQGAATLIIVPDDSLRGVPFAALQDEAGEYLIQKRPIAIAPALAYAQTGVAGSGKQSRVIAGVLGNDVVLDAGPFSGLSSARQEAEAAIGVERSGSGRYGEILPEFSEANLEKALRRGRIDILHLATHAVFNGRSDKTYIVAQDKAIPIAKLRSLVAAGRTRGDELDLIVLSACETATGDEGANMGLAGVAVQAGARSALASLWRVNDDSAADLMQKFYKHYRTGESKAKALQQAAIELLQGNTYQSPHAWAAFVLVGGWR